jgi:uncharacterized protein (TIGR03435 family)
VDKLPKFEVASVKPARPGNIGAPQAPPPVRLTLTTRRLMMQDLLQDRFHLVTHREKRQLPVYALVQFRNVGPRIPAALDVVRRFTVR